MIRLKTAPLLLLAFVMFFLLPLGSHGLWTPDETRYAQISQEMLMTGNWVTPHFMGIRYFEKPAGGYWLIAVAQAVFGENLFGVRIVSVLSTALSVLLAYLLARRLWNNPRKSFASALLYMSFGLIAGQAGYSNLDPLFTLWVNLSLVALWFAFDSRTRRARLAAWSVVGLACGLGFMTKGFLALMLPVLIALPFALWHHRWCELLMYGPLAVLVAVAISLPWVLAVHAQEPDYWRFFFWNEHIRRFAADNAQHARPWWFFLPILAVSCLPWAALLPTALHTAWKNRGDWRTGFLILCLLLPLAFFSVSAGKLPTYIMPCLFPLALLMGHALIENLDRGKLRAICLNGVLNFIIGMVTMVVLIYLQFTRPMYSNSHNDMFNLSLTYIVLMGWIIANLLQVIRPQTLWAAPVFGIWLLVALLPAGVSERIASNEMPDQFVLEHMDELQQTHSLLSNDLGAASALAWRLRRNEVALYNTVGELRYGLQYPDSVARKINPDTVGQWMQDARRKGSVGVLMYVKSTSEFHEAGALPPGGKRYRKGDLVMIVYPQKP